MKKSLISALAAAGLLAVPLLWTQQGKAQGPEVKLTLSPVVVRQAQQALNKAGFDAGEVDGNFDERVSAALASYQRSHGLEPTGQLSQRTLAALGITPQGSGQTGCDQAGGGQSDNRQPKLGQTDIGQAGGGQAYNGHNPVARPRLVRPTVVRPTVVRPTVARPVTRKMMTIGPSTEPMDRANSLDLPPAECRSLRDFR